MFLYKKNLEGEYGWCLVTDREYCWEDLVRWGGQNLKCGGLKKLYVGLLGVLQFIIFGYKDVLESIKVT